MKIEFRNKSQFGNNVIVEMYFDDIIAGTIRCNPKEYEAFTFLLDQSCKNSVHHEVYIV